MCAAQQERARKVLAAFKPFFRDARIRKVWHNYSFDRHVLANMGVAAAGFAGDTMHMARLWNSSRKGKGYTLENLSRRAANPFPSSPPGALWNSSRQGKG